MGCSRRPLQGAVEPWGPLRDGAGADASTHACIGQLQVQVQVLEEQVGGASSSWRATSGCPDPSERCKKELTFPRRCPGSKLESQEGADIPKKMSWILDPSWIQVGKPRKSRRTSSSGRLAPRHPSFACRPSAALCAIHPLPCHAPTHPSFALPRAHTPILCFAGSKRPICMCACARRMDTSAADLARTAELQGFGFEAALQGLELRVWGITSQIGASGLRLRV
eukprot:356691-Chlamydomonas_euryale.AAC.2